MTALSYPAALLKKVVMPLSIDRFRIGLDQAGETLPDTQRVTPATSATFAAAA